MGIRFRSLGLSGPGVPTEDVDPQQIQLLGRHKAKDENQVDLFYFQHLKNNKR